MTEWLTRQSLLEFSGDLREVPRIVVHLKIVTRTYIHVLQTNRHSFNQNQVGLHTPVPEGVSVCMRGPEKIIP